MICANCGKTFEKSYNHRVHCSKKCCQEYNRRHKANSGLAPVTGKGAPISSLEQLEECPLALALKFKTYNRGEDNVD